MGDSAKKLKQMRLPFAVLTKSPISTLASPTPKEIENSSPQASISSRKRKPSNDGDNLKSSKIGKISDSKENITDAEPDTFVEVDDSDIEDEKIDSDVSMKEDDTSILQIKLPSCSKSKFNVNMKAKRKTSGEEENADGSIVYLEEEKVQKNSKKSKKSVKKSKKKASPPTDESKAKKSLALSNLFEGEIIAVDDSSEQEQTDGPINVSHAVIQKPPECKVTVSPVKTVPTSDNQKIVEPLDSNKDQTSSSDKSHMPEFPEKAESINDELIEMLSDSDGSKNQNISSANDSTASPLAANLNNLKKLTPKQLKYRQKLEAQRLERELLRKKEQDEKEAQRLREKAARDEVKRLEKEAKEAAKRKDIEEREAKKMAEKAIKDEEKRTKEEERKRAAELKETATKKKEQERLEEENRKKRAAQAFTKFFVAKSKTNEFPSAEEETSKEGVEVGETMTIAKANFMPFQIRVNARVAPCVRVVMNKEQLTAFDKALKKVTPEDGLYLKQLKNGAHKPLKSSKTWPEEVENDIVEVYDELEGVGEDIPNDDATIKMKHRAKFFLFTENKRPAYHGTWRKASDSVSSRRPFVQDVKFFDYEVDSDDEWEEEEPGESLHGSDDEKDKDGEDDDYEVDNDFFVPHGHLSDEEMQQVDDDMNEDNSPEAQKAKLKILQQEFAAEMKKKTEKIKPRLIGCIWMNGDEDENGGSMMGELEKKYHCSDIIWRILKAREMMTISDQITLIEDLEPEVTEPEQMPSTPSQSKSQQRAKISDSRESIKELIQLIHGNFNCKPFLVREYQAYRLKKYHQDHDYQEFSYKSVVEKITEISKHRACTEEGELFGKRCRLVKDEVMKEYFGDETLKLPNAWTYILEKEKKVKQVTEVAKKEERAEDASTGCQSEEKDLAAKSQALLEPTISKESPKPQSVANVPSNKKRVQLLMSVPRGQSFSEAKKNNLISQYLKANQSQSDDMSKSNENEMDAKNDDVVIID